VNHGPVDPGLDFRNPLENLPQQKFELPFLNDRDSRPHATFFTVLTVEANEFAVFETPVVKTSTAKSCP